MKLKTNLHFHTAEDPEHALDYSIKQGIDQAVRHNFDVLALTCHQKFLCTPEHVAYAASKNILLIPGIEANISKDENDVGRHTLILNCTKDIEQVRTFAELEQYKKEHPEIFIIAPHPYFYGNFSLKEHLKPHRALFDAIEHSWFYSKYFNRNIPAQKFAHTYDIPYIATSDTHFFDFFDQHYALVEAEEKSVTAIFKAIKGKNFHNITQERNFIKDMVWRLGWFMITDAIKTFFKKRVHKNFQP